jgi:hypothetical protein
VYVNAPAGVMVNTLPEHNVPLFTVIDGVKCTVTLLMAPTVLEQPAVLVPLTV